MTAPTIPDDVRNRLRHVLLTISPLCPVDEQIDKFLLALSEAGYVVVPREPSEAMIAAFQRTYVFSHGSRGAREALSAAIAASEKP